MIAILTYRDNDLQISGVRTYPTMREAQADATLLREDPRHQHLVRITVRDAEMRDDYHTRRVVFEPLTLNSPHPSR